MSMWDAPPERKNRMVDFARPPSGPDSEPLARPGRPNVSPAVPTVEATRKARRESAAVDRKEGGIIVPGIEV
jgi:hypothetical protein